MLVTLRSLLVSAAVGAVSVAGVATVTPVSADIVWGSAQNMTGVGDIATNGTFLEATQTNNASPAVTVTNGAGQNFLFDAAAASGTASTGGYITITHDNGSVPNNGVNFDFAVPTSTNTNYNAVVSSGLDYETSGQTGTVSLNQLISGDSYQVEVWSFWDGGSATEALATLSGSTPVTISADSADGGTGAGDPAGQFAIGTFTATGSSQAFTFTVPSGSTYAVVNDVALWNVTSVPEPASLGMVAAGALGLMLVGRRRKVA